MKKLMVSLKFWWLSTMWGMVSAYSDLLDWVPFKGPVFKS